MENELFHNGTKGMKWGYEDGKPNGKRKAGDDVTIHSPSEATNSEYGDNYKSLSLEKDISLTIQEQGEKFLNGTIHALKNLGSNIPSNADDILKFNTVNHNSSRDKKDKEIEDKYNKKREESKTTKSKKKNYYLEHIDSFKATCASDLAKTVLESTKKNNTLSHYGIKGQKHGERHYQYPDGTYTPEGLKRYFGSDGSKRRKEWLENNPGKTDKDFDEYEKSKSNSLIDKAKNFYHEHETAIKVGAIAAGSALAIYGAYRLGAFNKIGEVIKDKHLVSGANDNLIATEDVIKNKKVKNILEKLKGVNPLRDSDNPVKVAQSKNNCFNIVMANVLRKREINCTAKGGLVEVNGKSIELGGGIDFNKLTSCFKKCKIEEIKIDNNENLCKNILSKFKEGDEGTIDVKWLSNGTRHAIYFNIINNQIICFDNQKNDNTVYNLLKLGDLDFSDTFKYSNLTGLEYIKEEILKHVNLA